MKKFITAIIFTVLSAVSINVNAEGLGPNAVSNVLFCKLKDGNSLEFMKNASMYTVAVRKPDDTPLFDITAHDQDLTQMRTNETDAKGNPLDGRFISIPNGNKNTIATVDVSNGVVSASIRYNVDMTSKAEYEASCVPDTIKGNIMDDSLFANVPN